MMPKTCNDCAHHRVYDWHYHYCAAHPDEKPALRPGGGKQMHFGITPPPDDCPLRQETP